MAEPVQSNDIEFARALVVFHRIAGRNDDPAIRYTVAAKLLALEELEHDGGESLRYAVDLVQEQDSFL